MLEQDENHLGTDEESSKESSLQSSLQDSSLSELGEKMSSTGLGAGMFQMFQMFGVFKILHTLESRLTLSLTALYRLFC